MATSLLKLALYFLVFSLFISINGEQPEFGRRLSRKKHGLRKEKLTHFRLYFHDIVSGPTPTATMAVAPPSNASTTRFGMIVVIDDPLTMGPEVNSKLVGRAQGLYSSSSQTEVGLLVAMNFVFIEGKYNGSTVSILGRNDVMSQVREMPIIGGSGLFRFARGYVQARTHTFNASSGDAVVEYNVFVMHY